MPFSFGNINASASVEVEDLFDSAAQFETILKPEFHEDTPREKIRIVAYSDDYFRWLEWDMDFDTVVERKPAKSRATAIVEELKGKSCKACAGTGLYRIHKFNKDIPCAKCAGKGHVSSIDEARGRAYAARKAAGRPMSVSHTDYIH